MTFRTAELQKLIADIDNLLANDGKRLSRLLPGQAQEGREVLQRVYDFLVELSSNEPSPPSTPESTNQPLSSLLARFVEQGNHQTEQQNHRFEAQQVKSEFSALLQPLQAELSELLQERANLIQEIRQLEQKRLQNYSLTQQLATQEQIISEFLQVLMSRLTTTLTPQSVYKEAESANLEVTPSLAMPIVESVERAERLASLTRELDQHLLSLDGTVNVVFEALQRNINTYHQSLSQALAKMHDQGLQGEQLMANFLHNLTQHLQQPLSPVSPGSEQTEQEAVVASLTTEAVSAQTEQETVISSLTTETVDLLASEELETPSDTEDLDAVLLQLSEEQPLAGENGSSNASHNLISANVDSVTGGDSDEVDQLYASLFEGGNANVQEGIAIALELNDPSTEQSEDSNDLELSEFWVNQQDTNLLDEEDQFLPEITDSLLTATSSPSESWDVVLPPEETLAANTEDILAVSLELPSDNVETITVLTDLLVDVGSEQPLLELPSWSNNSDMTPAELPPVAPVVTKSKSEQDLLSEQYISASPQENLLSLEDTTTSGIPDIFLDESQLQQLNQDLANFDRQSLESTSDFHDYQNLLNLNQPPLVEEEKPLPTDPPASTPETEKKKVASFSGQVEGSLHGDNDNNIDIQVSKNLLDAVWYLGIDLGTTGISAALFNRSKSLVYPIYWSAETSTGINTFEKSFRLPAEVYLPTASVPHLETEHNIEQPPAVVPQNHDGLESSSRLYSAQLKPYLQVAIPYKNERQKWEPVLQLNEFSAGPLIWVVRSLSKLLSTLKSAQTNTTPALIAHAEGIETADLFTIISKIAGVICTCPASWSEQYRFNIREAILTSQLVNHPQQVFFVEEAIASLLPEINGAQGELVQVNSPQGLSRLKTSDYPLLGNTLIINIGATATEMALADLPPDLARLAHKDFMLHSFNYAGKGMEQDIICQLLLPPKSRQPRQEKPPTTKTEPDPWHWQPSIPGLDQMQWQSLQLEDLELPKVGEPDLLVRIRLQQRLESSPLGQALLDAAVVLKLILQHQETFTLELADQCWILQRRDLESQVFVPFVRRLNRELNKLLVARGIPTEAINQAILTGGVASIGTVSRWLRQKLPNAKIIQDFYLGENGSPNCSRVAYGLALLPLHPQVLDVARQQYTDYFLFNELLHLLPDRSLSFGEVLQLFEGRGINTRACQQRLLAFLEGELPAGLIPDSTWLTHASKTNSDYQAIASAPLFEKLGNLSYRPNYPQVSCLRQYLEVIKASTLQSLAEPFAVNFVLETHN